MGYRQHWTTATEVAVQKGTSTEIVDQLGGEVENSGDEVHLVLNDAGNQEAFVIAGIPEELMRLAADIFNAAAALVEDGDHLVRIAATGNPTLAFMLKDDFAVTVEVDGREFAGVRMPEEDNPTSVIYWRDADGEDNVTVYPPGVTA